MPAYMKLGDIKGESQDARYPGWIEIQSWSNPGAVLRGGPTDNLDVSKSTDAASPDILRAATAGKPFPEVLLVYEHAEPGKSTGLRLINVFVTGYSVSSGGERAMEQLSLNFQSSEFLQEAQLQNIRAAKPGGKPGRKR